MALIYSEGFDNISSWNQPTLEFWQAVGHVLNGTITLGGTDGKFNGQRLAIGDNYRITNSNFAGTPTTGTIPSPLVGQYLAIFNVYTVTHPTEIRFAFWYRQQGNVSDKSGTNADGKLWVFRLRDYTGNRGIALWIDATASNNGITLSNFQANVGSQVKPTFSANSSNLRPWTGLWNDAQWHHIEVRFVAANGTNAAGSVEAWIDRQQVINVASIVTSNANTIDLTVLNSLEFSGESGTGGNFFDDVLIWDSTGNTMNSQIGPHRIRTLIPRANGTYQQFRGFANTGGNWYSLAEPGQSLNNYDTDTSYVEDSTVGDKDSYRMTFSNSNIGTVHSIVVKPIVKNPDVGSKSYSIFIRNNGAESNLGRILTTNTGYSVNRFIFNTDPATNTAWQSANVNTFEAGIQIES